MSETVVTDGRSGRATRTRVAVVDALLTLIDGGNLRPTAREVAEAAGVSLRSVYVHFDDVEALFVAAADRHFAHLRALGAESWDPDAPLTERLDQLVIRRRRIFEVGGQVRRAALLQAPFSPALRRALDFGYRRLRREIDEVFAAELATRPDAEGARLRSALEIALGPGTWDTLRTLHGLDPDGAAALASDMARAALAAWAGTATPTTGDSPSRGAGPA